MTALLTASHLSKFFPVAHGRGKLHAVDDVDLKIMPGECLGLVGESGCGKSTLSRLVARLIEPTSGSLDFQGTDIGAEPLARFARSPHRAAIQVVFQDANESLNPGFTALRAVMDPIRKLVPGIPRAEVEARAHAAFDDVGLPRELSRRYPHQLSGGQKARVGIARAIAVEPKLLVLDEPTSALDVSVQAVILKLLGELRQRKRMSYLFVSHDLEVIRLICDRVAVMYLGKLVETGPTEALFAAPGHPYTRALLDGSPDPNRRGIATPRLAGSASSPIDPDPARCRFAGRCPVAIDRCTSTMPALREIGAGHLSACHLAEVQTDLPAAPSRTGTD